MSGTTVAKVHWRALDRDGEDTCRLCHMDDGWMLVGHARFRSERGWSALDYVVRCGADWLTQSADVTGVHNGANVALRFLRTGEMWTLGDLPRPELRGASDIDFGFSPATNLMPVRRLPEVGRIDTKAVWLRDPAKPPETLDQSYTRERGGLVRYHAEQTGFTALLSLDDHGFVLAYPGLWEQDNAP
ncbi:putative glycolipid-binding domain-containing protein [Aestuariicoccus sp. MJ-SS9]|uniref:putative glycolipid-binding domain-containing protein n=1 Tax=Aestuariicoccus sp. MJ-SS9 TaxID=3079855 RepID=UPI0029093A54|nr:putative glycolipid-binding domain-containing protein [Aestuariicoccus sp. MJ-SS9]MDU8910746.1 putative glycolipid-binding domain-containing protein [Aestuariicoccus sp. MJ-SS9]